MVISFRICGRRSRYHPPLPPACTHAAAASLEGPPPPRRPPWEAVASGIDCANAVSCDFPEGNDVDSVEPDLEPSFALNLFPDGYSIGDPGKGMLTYLIGDDPKKRPYSRASKAFFADIEYGCLPPEVLQDTPCKFLNGSTVCEVRDYRVLSNGGDYSGDDFPKVNRVSLRLGTGCVVKDLSSIADASWTYHDQLIAESVVLNALQPRLNLDPTSCLEVFCSSKKIDLGLDKGSQQTEDKSLCISTIASEDCKPDEFIVCISRTVCIEDEALEGMQSGNLKSTSVNCSSMILLNNARSPAEPDPNNTIQSYTLKNNSALSEDSKGRVPSIASEHIVQGNDLQAQVVALQVDSKNGQPQIGTSGSWKRKKCSNLVQERHELKKRCSPNKTAILNSQHSKVTEKSIGTSHKEKLDLVSPKVMVDQIIDDKDMKVNQERCEAPVVNLSNSGPKDPKERRTCSVTSFSGSSREAAFKPHKAGTETKHTASKGNILGILTVPLKEEGKFKRKRLKNVDILHKSPCENRNAEEQDVIGGISSQLGIGLVQGKRRQQTKDITALHKTADSLKNRKPIEFNICEGAAICIENATLEGRPCVKFNSSSVNYASSIHDNDANSSVQSDPNNTIRSSKLTDISAKYYRKQSTSGAPDHLPQSFEQKAQATVRLRKRNKSLKVLHEKHRSKSHIPPGKTERLVSKSCIGLQKLAGTSNKQGGLELGSPKEMHAMVNQETGNKSMEVSQQLPLPVLQTSHLCTSPKRNNPCIMKMSENITAMYVRLKAGREAPVVALDSSSMAGLRGSTTPSVNSYDAGSRKAYFKPQEDNPASNRKGTVTSTVSSNLEINSEGNTHEIVDMQIKSVCEERSPEPPCVNKSSEEIHVTSGISRQLSTSPNQRSCTEHCMPTSEPDTEKILSEVILPTQRHRLNGKAARHDGLGTTSSLVQSECFQPGNAEKYLYIREETISYYATGRVTSSCKIRRIIFHPSQYFSCKGIIDDSHYTLCLVESQAPDDHQIMVGTIYGDEHTHIATLPTYCHAEKFVDQFILLMKRDGYNICDDKVLTGPSELRQQFKDVSQLCYDTGECAQYLMPSPSVVNSSAIKENNNVGCTFQNRVPDYVNILQQETEHWVMTQQSRSLGTPESFFLNPSPSGGLQHTNRILQHMGPSFACSAVAINLHHVPSAQLSQQVSMGEYGQYLQCRHDANNVFAVDLHQVPSVQLSQQLSMGEYDQYSQCRHDANNVFAMDLHQVPSVQLSQQVSMGEYDQYLQCRPNANNVFTMDLNHIPSVHLSEDSIDQYWQRRHDVPGFSGIYGVGTSGSSYSQWRPVPTQLGNVVYQWDLPAFARQINNSPLPHDGRIVPWSELQPIRSTPIISCSMYSEEGCHRYTSSAPQSPELPVPVSWTC